MIRLKNIYKSYQNPVLKNVSLSLGRGELVVLLGRSGSGKSTLLDMINFLQKPDSGEVVINGQNLNELSQKDINLLRHKIGYVMQYAGLFPHLKVGENISFISRLIRLKNPKQKLSELCAMLGLSRDILERYPDELSGGQAQRASIARALFNDPEIVLFDEPFSALDKLLKQQLQSEIKALVKSKNLSVVFVTHDVDEALFLASRIVVLERGEIVFDGDKKQLKNSDNKFVKELFSSYLN